jgi:hypothetical protein
VIPRIVLGAFLAAVMVVMGTATYMFIGARQSKVAAAPEKPTLALPSPHAFILPGTLYLAQSGALYSLSGGRFHQLTTEDGWTQPELTPDGSYLLAVHKTAFYSDVFELTRFGRPLRQLTNNAAPRRSYDTGDNHWSFYPRLTADGKTLFMSYDSPKFGYEVDLSVWGMPFGGSGPGKIWTDSQGYTGGDIQPVPVPGGIVYTKYLRNPDGSIISQLWFTNRPGALGKALTTPGADCREPSFSPDGRYIAMICTYTKQVSNLVIAPWLGSALGQTETVVSDQMVAQPTWAPDGSGIAYLAPALPDGPFQLWFAPRLRYFPPVPSPVPTPSLVPGGPEGTPVPSPSPSPLPPPPLVKVIQITSDLGLDASSTMTWAP